MIACCRRRLARTVHGLIFLAVLVGCAKGDAPSLGRVSGVVTLDGAPLGGATVVFQPAAGGDSRATTDVEGRYELHYLRDIQGALVGEHTVRITTASEQSPGERLPDRYHRRSELVRQVEPGDNTINFALDSN